MKHYQTSFACYGQSVASRVAYWQKMGVARGIISEIKSKMRRNSQDSRDWEVSLEVPHAPQLSELSITVVIPTPEDRYESLKYPHFALSGKRMLIDMLHINSELQVHMMDYDRETESFKNVGWHTVRECISLEDTCTLFEYIEDRIEDLIILPPEDTEKYYATGALGVGINKEG